jgi:hypothetical protein
MFPLPRTISSTSEGWKRSCQRERVGLPTIILLTLYWRANASASWATLSPLRFAVCAPRLSASLSVSSTRSRAARGRRVKFGVST